MPSLPSLPVLVALLIAYVGSFSRIFDASKPFWGRFPGWLQVLAPQITLALGTFSAGLAGGIKSWTDLAVVFVAALGLLLPGAPSNRSKAPLPRNDAPWSESAGGGAAGLVLLLALGGLGLASLQGCGLIAAAAPILAETGVVIADAANAVSAAEALLPSLHLDAAEEAKAEAAIARARKAIAAAAAADASAQDLSSEQLDASLAAFREAWADLQGAFAAKHIGDAEAVLALPVPLAVRRVQK